MPQQPVTSKPLSASSRTPRRRRILPGFGLTLGVSVLYLSLIVLIPLSTTFVKTSEMGWGLFWATITAPRMLAAYKLSLGASFGAALINAVFGLLIAWVLVRYHFPGKKLVDAAVDLPFALPTAVAGIALTQIYAPNGWLGQFFDKKPPSMGAPGFIEYIPLIGHQLALWMNSHPVPHLPPPGLQIAYTPLGVLIALTFIGIPFVVRTVQPVLEDLDHEFEEAAASLGATHWQTFCRVIFPEMLPSLLTGFALAFARALGEYGSVVFISGNLPMKTEIVPLMIISKLEQYSYTGAAAIAVVMLVASFFMLLVINLLQRWSSAYRAVQA